jgi:hypothetical protein
LTAILEGSGKTEKAENYHTHWKKKNTFGEEEVGFCSIVNVSFFDKGYVLWTTEVI